jgi:hypothetical protein
MTNDNFYLASPVSEGEIHSFPGEFYARDMSGAQENYVCDFYLFSSAPKKKTSTETSKSHEHDL